MRTHVQTKFQGFIQDQTNNCFRGYFLELLNTRKIVQLPLFHQISRVIFFGAVTGRENQ